MGVGSVASRETAVERDEGRGEAARDDEAQAELGDDEGRLEGVDLPTRPELGEDRPVPKEAQEVAGEGEDREGEGAGPEEGEEAGRGLQGGRLGEEAL